MIRIDAESPLGRVLRVAAVAGPAILLGAGWLRGAGETAWWFGNGAAVAVVVALATLVMSRGLPPLGVGVMANWPIAWIFAAIPTAGGARESDWYVLFLDGVLPLPALAVASAFVVRQSGAILIQHARRVAHRISTKADWPDDLHACLDLPLVRELREAICFDATPAIQLLSNAKPEVRLCALAAMERRLRFRTGQMERIVALLRKETEPEILAAALRTLFHCHEVRILEAVVEKLQHSSQTVRHAAAEVLLRESSSRRRWQYIRTGVHEALGDGSIRDEGSFLPSGQRIHPDAVEDFLAWSAERGVVGIRAANTLAVHFLQLMVEQPQAGTWQVRQLAEDVNRPAQLRVALARLLCDRGYADPPLLETLIAPVNPAPLRLVAADALLQGGPHMRSIACLREIGRIPNRELSLVTADVVQRRLGIDMGLAMGQPLPGVSSSRAVEVQRRLMTWASKIDHSEDALDTNFSANRSPQGN
jgi:hypothetical protein